MEPILPNLAALLGTPPRADAAPVRAQVLNLPTQLLQAPAPVSLPGTVVESGVAGQLRITTAMGDVQLRAPTELPIGRAVTIVTRPAAPTEVFLLTTPAPVSTTPTGPAMSPPASPPAGIAVAVHGSGQLIAAANRPVPTVPGPTPSTATASTPPNTPSSGTTLAPALLLAALEAAVLPDPVGRASYVPAPQPGTPAELLAVLTEVRRLVASRDPMLAERLQRRLPTADRSGALAMLALPLAARQERLAAWLGRDVAAVIDEDSDDGVTALLPRLESALAQVEERVEQADDRTWRWRQLPLVENGQLISLAIGVASEREQPAADGGRRQKKDRAVTFAVEVSLSALGGTRVEATFRERHLDLLVQCESALAPDSCGQIAEAVGAVLGEFGLTGRCRFAPYRKDAATAVKV